MSWRLRVKFGLVERFVLQSRLADSSATPIKNPNVHRAIHSPSECGWKKALEQRGSAYLLTLADLLMEELAKHNYAFILQLGMRKLERSSDSYSASSHIRTTPIFLYDLLRNGRRLPSLH